MNLLHTSAGAIVRATREKLLPHWGNVPVERNKGGGAIDVVTKLDLEIEQFLASELKKLEPSIGFAGEEYGGDRDGGRFWLCDPIDGTAHFVRGLPFCTVMLALIEGGQVTSSFIYDFINDDLYHAQRGEGAFKNDTPISVSNRPITDAYLGWETHTEKEENMQKFLQLRQKATLFKALCAGWEMAMVACGKLDGRIQFDGYGKDWDYSPGSLLISEAGGVVANIGVSSYHYANLNSIMANTHVFDALTSGPEAVFPIAP